MNTPPGKPSAQSPHFYFRDRGMLILEAENVLFRVHEHFLHRDSPVLRDLVPTEISNTGPEAIFHLDGVKSKDLEHLLWLYYNPLITDYTAPRSTWLAILRLADRFSMTRPAQIALEHLMAPTATASTDPLERIMLCERPDMSRSDARDAYVRVCTREAALTAEEIARLSPAVVGIIGAARERILRMRSGLEDEAVEVVHWALEQAEGESD
ncbi:unnamed protein product [Mycena citricolor]|uniref:BTB domain-containing protein n=1 Tax=Mycena citricolor TaxID=2018698 RepID=A0AAD2JX18_9AGAR|nr:unnamed protein product [Mycena citricolor]